MEAAYAAAEPWAELRIIRGEGPSRVLFHAHRAVCISVGSDPAAGLTIAARNVAPAQFSLVWDGTHLWLEDVLRLGRTRINGRTLNEWRCVQGHAVVTFGSAWLALRSTGPLCTRKRPDLDLLDHTRSEAHGRLRRCETIRNIIPWREEARE